MNKNDNSRIGVILEMISELAPNDPCPLPWTCAPSEHPDGDWQINDAEGNCVVYLSNKFNVQEFVKWLNTFEQEIPDTSSRSVDAEPSASGRSRDGRPVKLAKDLSSGDYFSYPGSFKIYQALSDPEIDPEFYRAVYNCQSCGQVATHHPRVILNATDGRLNECIGIRLRSDVECMIYRSYNK